MSEPKLCSGPECGVLFEQSGDDWYRLDRMHDDRVGDGTHYFHSAQCAILWLAEQVAIGKTQIVRPGVTRS